MSDDVATGDAPATDQPESETPADDPADTLADADSHDAANETHGDSVQPEPTPQAEALRRQQLYVGAGVSALAGVAVVVAGIQQFPGFSLLVYLLFGMATTTLLFGLLVASMFASAAE
ncbi:hypothetical protein [Salinibaculum salinum]|uniref:hypothetical protein n=1 Tax=Salinibaculum salinum TaxID=3131996 RepID=UPI0030ECCCE6